MASTYQVIFINNSNNVTDVCIFQEHAKANDPTIFTLAWITKRTNPKVKDEFRWTKDSCFVWSETGAIVPGVTFESSQVVPTGSKNNITFTKKDGAYDFEDLTTAANNESLTIACDASIPQNQAAVGIGMSGAGTFVCQASPNERFDFSPGSKYKITCGNYIEQGQVIDPASFEEIGAIDFPANVYSMTATLNPDNTWTIKPMA